MKRSQRDSIYQARHSERHRDGQISPQTATTAQKSLASKPENVTSCSVRVGHINIPFKHHQSRDESIRAARCNRWVERAISDVLASDRSSHFRLIHIPLRCVNGTDLSPVAVSYLLWGRAPHWLGWTSTSWRTPPPRPRHSRSRSTGRDGGHKPKREGAERGTERSLTVVKCHHVVKEES